MNCYIYIYKYISSSIMCIYVYYHETNKSWCILKVWLLQHLKLVWTHRDSNPNLKRPAWLVGHDWWVMTGRFGAGVEQRKVGHDEHLRDIPAGWWCPVVCALGSRLEDESSFGCTAWSHLICCLLFVEPCSRLSYDVFSSTGGERYKTSESWWILYGCSFGVAWKVGSPKIQPSSIATRR